MANMTTARDLLETAAEYAKAKTATDYGSDYQGVDGPDLDAIAGRFDSQLRDYIATAAR